MKRGHKLNRNHIILILLTLSIIALAGCTATAPVSKDSPFIGGTDAIKMDFVADSPPAEVTDGNQFPFDATVRLQNTGEDDVEANEVIVELSGISPNDFGGTFTKNPGEKLLGKHKDIEGNVIEGTTSYVTFPGFKFKGKLAGNTPFTLRADLCSRYETKSVSKLCILKEQLAFGEEGVCKVGEPKTVFNSGSPIQIDSMTESIAGQNKISFTFDIAHKGTGAIFGIGNKLCSPEIINKNKVHVKVDTGIGSGAVCSGLNGNEGDVPLFDGRRSITCTQDITGTQNNFEEPVTISIKFDYKQHIDTPLLVKHLSD